MVVDRVIHYSDDSIQFVAFGSTMTKKQESGFPPGGLEECGAPHEQS
jgi:hypothetical protein